MTAPFLLDYATFSELAQITQGFLDLVCADLAIFVHMLQFPGIGFLLGDFPDSSVLLERLLH